MDKQYILSSAIDEAKQAVVVLEGWIDTLERVQKGLVLSRQDFLAHAFMAMNKAGLGVGFLNAKFYDEVFEAMTGERP